MCVCVCVSSAAYQAASVIMVTDSQLGVIVNVLGVAIFMLVVAYHYVAAPSSA